MGKTTKITARKPKAERDSTVTLARKKGYFKTVDSPVGQILHLQRTIGNQAVQRLFKSNVIQAKLKIGKPNDKYEKEADRVVDQVVQLKNSEKTSKTKFKPLTDKAANEEFKKLKAKYRKEGKDEREADFLAMDDMFAERLKVAGGKRLPGTATLGKLGEKTYLSIPTKIIYNDMPLPLGFYNAGIDDKSYNCHSFTFNDAKTSKLTKLKTIAKTIPEGPVKGKKYFDAVDLVRNMIHFEMGPPTLIFPRWVISPAEIKSLLKTYRPRKAIEKLETTKRDIVIYSTNGDFPHSGKVTQVDAKGKPIKIKSKWGHYSLFEHDPETIPAHYGRPSYFRKK